MLELVHSSLCYLLYTNYEGSLDNFNIPQMVSLLLVKGANVKAKDRRERIPLHLKLAAYMGIWTMCDSVADSL